MKRFVIALGLCLTFVASIAQADDAQPLGAGQWPPMRLSEGPAVSATQESPAVQAKRMRIQRSAYRAQQRMLRQEYNAWMGIEPLRPSWSAVPMTTSRYPEYNTIVVPIFVP